MRSTLVLLLALVLAEPVQAATDRQTRAFPWSSTRTLVLELTVGDVRILGSDRADVDVAVQRSAPTNEGLQQLPLVVEDTPERVTLRLVQADGGTDAAFRTDVVLRIPLDAKVERVRVMEGKLTVEQLRGALTADVGRGPIDATDVAGALRLETGIGSIRLKNARLSPGGLLRLRAFNGDIRLQMPGAPSDARVMALALNGTIQSDIPMTTRDGWGPRWSEATLGKGEPVISIDVVTGKVEIKTR
jgi:DUF4097 and DUF4098 domain-containing protein YvlB